MNVGVLNLVVITVELYTTTLTSNSPGHESIHYISERWPTLG